MGFDNTVTVVGNVTRDPELRFSQAGMAIAQFGVAWNRRRQDQDDEVSFFDVTCFRQLAENVAESIRKGSRVVIYGTLQQRSWQTDGGDRRSKVEILADDVAPSLKWATAEIARNERSQGGGDYGGDRGGGGRRNDAGSRPAPNRSDSGSAPAADADPDDEPF
ncbi:MAG: single-stranded DNA-binding protein [Acidimicrobiaceae bacterium]|nr:single-stranded DNA-binding protein [Acidimicrobiaceae bacterium]MCY4176854.1 single-stranded DNA-binding protein [Acidimicrobiaceae bacterium]MCY4279609.1 single-stranded DNA-binding protein [Acidimicrobiaceae bacterium]MCY4293979.1 single-stranded DNA-binding protein [Acidimicrobiaceae bacterium]